MITFPAKNTKDAKNAGVEKAALKQQAQKQQKQAARTQKRTKKTFFISTAIDYPNSDPHLGHAYEKICADAIARFMRLQGFDVHFSTGTDEHGLKIQRAAERAGLAPKQFVDEMSKRFVRLCATLGISYDDFIRTTERRHEDVVLKVFEKINAKGDIYKGTYSGYYCVDCETFYEQSDLQDGNCPFHGKKADYIEEESYFFKMSKYQNFLINHIKKNKDFILPRAKAKEILNRLKEPLHDLSISRTMFDWGIPTPIDARHVLYVWMDALLNYISTVDYPNAKFRKYWPCDMHLIGKDIAWHHTVIWGSILHAAGVQLPKTVFVHGFVNVEGQKLSKSRGIVVDPIALAERYGADALRYYLLSEMPFGEDGNFSEGMLIERTNNELIANYCNLFYRVTHFIDAHFNGRVPEGKLNADDKAILKKSEAAVKKYIADFSAYKIRDALLEAMSLSGELNKYFQSKKPWESPQHAGAALYVAANVLHDITSLLAPFVPQLAEKAFAALGTRPSLSARMAIKPSHRIKAVMLKKKIEVKMEEKAGKDGNRKKDSIKESKGNKEKTHIEVLSMAGDILPFTEFKKVDMRVATVTRVDEHPDADKLYILTVDLGDEQRQLVAGLREKYTKGDLQGKQVIVVTNLQPRSLRGAQSEGMLLAAEDGTIISPTRKVPNGSRIM